MSALLELFKKKMPKSKGNKKKLQPSDEETTMTETKEPSPEAIEASETIVEDKPTPPPPDQPQEEK